MSTLYGFCLLCLFFGLSTLSTKKLESRRTK
nr:MAG TPA: hypothetical protein [Bacteriophage sp.]